MVYLIKRIFFSILMLFGITIIAFLLSIMTPGDPATLALSGTNSFSYTQEDLAEMKSQMGLDKSYKDQYIHWVANISKGSLGKSFNTQNEVYDDIKARFPNTLKLSISTLIFSMLISFSLAIISIIYKNKFIEKFIDLLSIINISLPSFWFAIILMIIFSIKLRLLPTNGLSSARHYVLPVLTLSVSTIGTVTRFIKSLILSESEKLYVNIAKSKGLERLYIVCIHILPNIFIPVLAYYGNYFSAILGGSVIIESVFSINGLGKYALEAVQLLDYPALQAYVLVTGITYIVVNLFIDIIYCLLNPKIRLGGN